MTLVVDQGRPVSLESGLADERQALAYLSSKTFQQCVRGDLTLQQAHQRGELATEGNLSNRDLLGALGAVARNGVPQDA
jgi:hypothetical protein